MERALKGGGGVWLEGFLHEGFKDYVGEYGVFVVLVVVVTVFCIRVKTFNCIEVGLFVFSIRFLVWSFCNVGGSCGRRG